MPLPSNRLERGWLICILQISYQRQHRQLGLDEVMSAPPVPILFAARKPPGVVSPLETQRLVIVLGRGRG
jgi:hypothetical protein